uniref:serine C-palmitoyltransferase n=1 Tax=Romanomermis culicivorax TaxID=13658 RepID=A0A915IXD9_ROMCU
MGTFTKSFASAGGYIAGKSELVDYLRANSHTVFYGSAMSPPLVQQILTSMSVIMGRDKREDGLKRMQTLARNTRYLRAKLSEKGFTLYGHPESPVVPVMIYFLSKITYASRWLIERGVGMVVVGFPATSMTTARARLCLSASHTKQDLDKALEVLNQLGDEISIRHNSRKKDENGSKSVDY